MQNRWRVAKNALANLSRGAVAGLIAIFLPAVLVRHMSQIDYSIWVLVLQVGAYGAYLEFGLQTAVGRYIAVAKERNDPDQRDAIFSTAIVGLSISALIGITLLFAVVCASRWLFPKVPTSLLLEMRWALMIVGTSIALGLPAAAWIGVFIGLQRNEFIAIVAGASKLVSALALVIAAIHGSSLLRMAIIVATVNLASYLALYLLVRQFSETRLRLRMVSLSVARELSDYCFSLGIWSFSMLLVTGLDLILVGRFQLNVLAPYALASTLVTFIAGIQNGVFSAMMPHAAVLHARRDSTALGKMLVSATRFGVLLLLFTGLPLMIYAGPLLRIWVGPQYAAQGKSLLTILLIANMIRLVGTPYATALVASGQQRLVILSPLMEGVSNLIASIVLGMSFGALGVAAGTLVGALVGVLGNLFYNMPRTRTEIVISRHDYVISGIGLPFLATLPLIAFAVSAGSGKVSQNPPFFAVALGGSLLLSLALVVLSTRSGEINIRDRVQRQE